MSISEGARRVLALSFAIVVAVSAAGGAVAGAPAHNVCARQGHGCADTALRSCCCGGESQQGSQPAGPVEPRAQIAHDALTPSLVAFVPLAPAMPRLPASTRLVPRHGHHTTDLLALLSTFLI